MIQLALTPDNADLDVSENIIQKLDNAKDLTRFVELALINRDRYSSKSDCLATITVGAFQFAARKITRDRFTVDLAKRSIVSSLHKLNAGHFILDFNNLLSVERLNDNYFPTVRRLMWEHRVSLAAEAEKLLLQQPNVPAKIKRHWVYLANLPLLQSRVEFEVHSQNILNNAENL